MHGKLRKILSLVLSFCFLFQQASFAQVAAELNLSSYFSKVGSGLTQEKFRPLHLRYFSYDNTTDNFKVLLDKGSLKEVADTQAKQATKDLLSYFLVGVSLPDSLFWVNLRPDAQDQIIDPALERTDLGKIMLEADLQLKKDTAALTSPRTSEGKAYWAKLYKKAAELYGNDNTSIPTLTRPWIVPGEVIVRETKDSAYVYKAGLKVMLEQDYLKDSSVYNFPDARSKALNEYSSQLIRELIIPKLTRDVNSAKRYSALRQVYYSLILSRWFKSRFTGKEGTYPKLINTSNLANLTSSTSWSKSTYFNAYKKSFADGEYNISEPVSTPTGQVIRTYFSGGIQIGTGAINTQNGISSNSIRIPEGAGIMQEGIAKPGDDLSSSSPLDVKVGWYLWRLGSSNVETRKKAARALGVPGDEQRVIKALLDKLGDEPIKITVQTALRNLGVQNPAIAIDIKNKISELYWKLVPEGYDEEGRGFSNFLDDVYIKIIKTLNTRDEADIALDLIFERAKPQLKEEKVEIWSRPGLYQGEKRSSRKKYKYEGLQNKGIVTIEYSEAVKLISDLSEFRRLINERLAAEADAIETNPAPITASSPIANFIRPVDMAKMGKADKSRTVLISGGGGDCAGLNSLYNGLVSAFPEQNLKLVGVRGGPRALIKSTLGDFLVDFVPNQVLGRLGSTILGSDRVKFSDDDYDALFENVKDFRAVVLTGGDDHGQIARKLAEKAKQKGSNLLVAWVPKTIDNDVKGQPLGAATAAEHLREETWRMTLLAQKLGVVMVTETMGRESGSLTFESSRTNPPDLNQLPGWLQGAIRETKAGVLNLVSEKNADLRSILEEGARIIREQGFLHIRVAEGFAISADDPLLKKLLEIDAYLGEKSQAPVEIDIHGNPKLGAGAASVSDYIYGLFRHLDQIAPDLHEIVKNKLRRYGVSAQDYSDYAAKLTANLALLRPDLEEKIQTAGGFDAKKKQLSGMRNNSWGMLFVPEHKYPNNVSLNALTNFLGAALSAQAHKRSSVASEDTGILADSLERYFRTGELPEGVSDAAVKALEIIRPSIVIADINFYSNLDSLAEKIADVLREAGYVNVVLPRNFQIKSSDPLLGKLFQLDSALKEKFSADERSVFARSDVNVYRIVFGYIPRGLEVRPRDQALGQRYAERVNQLISEGKTGGWAVFLEDGIDPAVVPDAGALPINERIVLNEKGKPVKKNLSITYTDQQLKDGGVFFKAASSSPIIEKARAQVLDLLKQRRSLTAVSADRIFTFGSNYTVQQALDELAKNNWAVKKEGDRYYYRPFRLMGQATGRTDMSLLKSLGADGILGGHSETRDELGVTNEMTGKIMLEAYEVFGDFNAFAFGEPATMRYPKGDPQEGKLKPEGWPFLKAQVTDGLSGLPEQAMRKTIEAYEPVWAIGPKAIRTAKPNEAQEVHAYVRNDVLPGLPQGMGKDVVIPYGGSMKPDNVDGLMAEQDVDGGLIGGASLVEEQTLSLIRAMVKYVRQQRNEGTFNGRIPTLGFNLKAEVGGAKMDAQSAYLRKLMDTFKFIQDNLADVDLENEIHVYFVIADTEIPLFNRAFRGENPVDLLDLREAKLINGIELAVAIDDVSAFDFGAHTGSVTAKALHMAGVKKVLLKTSHIDEADPRIIRARAEGLEVVPAGSSQSYFQALNLERLQSLLAESMEEGVFRNSLIVVPPALAREAYAYVKANASSPLQSNSSSSARETPATTGGIDFRAIKASFQPMGSFKNLKLDLPKLSRQTLEKIDLEAEMRQMKNMVEKGIAPSGIRIKELIAACVQKGQLDVYSDSLLLCLIDICKMQEENVTETSRELKEAFVLLDVRG